MKTKEKDVYSLLLACLKDKEVTQDEACRTFLTEAKLALDKKESFVPVAARLSKNISSYLMAHGFEAPKSLVTLAQAIEVALDQQRGLTSIPFWASNLFGH